MLFVATFTNSEHSSCLHFMAFVTLACNSVLPLFFSFCAWNRPQEILELSRCVRSVDNLKKFNPLFACGVTLPVFVNTFVCPVLTRCGSSRPAESRRSDAESHRSVSEHLQDYPKSLLWGNGCVAYYGDVCTLCPNPADRRLSPWCPNGCRCLSGNLWVWVRFCCET